MLRGTRVYVPSRRPSRGERNKEQRFKADEPFYQGMIIIVNLWSEPTARRNNLCVFCLRALTSQAGLPPKDCARGGERLSQRIEELFGMIRSSLSLELIGDNEQRKTVEGPTVACGACAVVTDI